MTLYQFNQLDELEQLEAIWEHGIKIAVRVQDEYKLTLFQIDSFYVEVWHHLEHGVDKRYRSFSSTDQLAPYLDQLNINGLL